MHPDDYHSRFRVRHKLGAHDWGILHPSLAMRCIALAGCTGQLDLPNLAVIEALFREAQMAEYYYRQIDRDEIDKNAPRIRSRLPACRLMRLSTSRARRRPLQSPR